MAPSAPQTVILPPRPLPRPICSSLLLQSPAGERIKPEQLKWQPWPSELVPAGAILRSTSPSAIDSLKGAAARVDIAAGDVMTSRKAVRLGDSGYLATILSPGMRRRRCRSIHGARAPPAVSSRHLIGWMFCSRWSIPRTRPNQPRARFLQNVRVLAIGQQIGDMTVQATAVSPNVPPPTSSNSMSPGAASSGQGGSQRLFMADNATLEVTPAQALDLAAAAKGGEITLVLRASNDAADNRDGTKQRQTVTKIGFGIVRQVGSEHGQTPPPSGHSLAQLRRAAGAGTRSGRAGARPGALRATVLWCGCRSGRPRTAAARACAGGPGGCASTRRFLDLRHSGSAASALACDQRSGCQPPNRRSRAEHRSRTRPWPSRIIQLPRIAREAYVANPKVAYAELKTSKTLYLSGIGDGATSIIVSDDAVSSSRRSSSG